jgi:PAT family beta-lactamase induction signal transducer AmpG
MPENTAPLWRDPLLLRMLGFGFLSGLPLPLSIFTLQQWFTLSGVSIAHVSHAAWLGLPYTLKFLWAPVFDRKPPRWAGGVGRRRFNLFIVQALLALSCVGLALSNPAVNAGVTAAAALALAFMSASQDILIDAWRIETFPQDRQGAALARYIWGYRTAMLVSFGGVVWASVYVGWHVALLGIAAMLALGPVLVAFSPEPVVGEMPPRVAGPWAAFQSSFLAPLGEFLRRRGAIEVLAFVVLFKLGKVLADNNAASFYHHVLGFGSAVVAKANLGPQLLGVFAGAAFGGLLVKRLGTIRAVLIGGALQAASLGLYLLLMATGGPLMLFIKVGGEFFCENAANAAFLAFLSGLCAREFTATQYALLSSLAAITLHSVSGEAGNAVVALGWVHFYIATIVLSLPALAIMLHLRTRLSLPDR